MTTKTEEQGAKAARATNRIDPAILNILAASRVDGTQLFLPPGLDPKSYKKVNVVLESIGGKWSRKSQSHVFDDPAEDVVEAAVLTGEYTNRKQLFQFFETPADLADRLVAMAEIGDAQAIMEPSAGRGRILKAIHAATGHRGLFYCELDPANKKILERDCGDFASWMGGDFLELPPYVAFDRIVANPPFSRQQDIRHVVHMVRCLNPGGIVVSVMSAAVTFRDDARTKAFREMVEFHDGSIEELPAGTFKESGTMVNACVVKIVKPV